MNEKKILQIPNAHTLFDASILDKSLSRIAFPLVTIVCSKALLISSAVQPLSPTAAHQLALYQPGKNHTKSGPASFSLITYKYDNSITHGKTLSSLLIEIL